MRNRWLIVLLILLIAAVFRFQHIASIPPGLYPDEAMNGNDALQANNTGNYKVFYPENNGREGLFINIQALSIKIFGNQPWALRIVSAIIGVLTVWGTYFLATELFNWQIGAFSSFLLAISFWHTMFSRIGFRAIMAPFFVVWGLYFFWRGLSRGRFIDFIISGLCWGLGMYTYLSFRVIPLIVVLTVLAYWRTIKKDFDHKKYEHTRDLMAQGFSLLVIVAIIVFLPLAWYFYTHPGDFLGRTNQISVLAAANPVKALAINTIKTLGMFNFTGDYNWRHNLSGEPQIFWPVGVLFALGFFRALLKLIKPYKKHGHVSTTQVMLLTWFFVGLLPVIISNEGLPHALRAIIVAPVVFIFAGEGLWWIYEKIVEYYRDRDFHKINIFKQRFSEGSTVAVLVVLAFLITSGCFEYNKYFHQWAANSNVPPAFAQNYVDIGRLLNEMPQNIKKYVLVNASGTLVYPPYQPAYQGSWIIGISMPAQTVMFITDTWTPAKQKAKNIYYLTSEQYANKQFDKNGIILPLEGGEFQK